MPGPVTRCYPDWRVTPQRDAGDVEGCPSAVAPRTQQPGSVLRKYLVAILAVPVLLGVYASAALGRSRFVRGGVAVGLGGMVAFGAIAFARPTLTTASPVADIVPLTQASFRMAVGTNMDLLSPATIMFTTPMERESVEAAVSVDPPLGVKLDWSADDSSVSIVPTEHWAPGTYYTISVGPGALASTGRPMTSPARAAFLTRDAATALLGATSKVDKRITTDASFTVTFDHDVNLTSVGDAIHLDPPATGALTRTTSADGSSTYTFIPSQPLKPDTTYRLVVDGARDSAGLLIDPVAMRMRTVAAPTVVRFRPRDDTSDVERDATISVRFNAPMDRTATKKAFSVTAGGKAVAGTVRFAENDTVLIFDPSSNLAFGATVVMTVAGTAESASGMPLRVPTTGTFKVVGKPTVKRAAATTRTATRPITRGGGGSVGSGTWGAVERYYLRLMNCTRTGGWVTSGGACGSPGGRSVAPLRLDSRHQRAGLATVRAEARREQHVHPFQRRQSRRPTAARRLLELPLGGEPRLPVGQRLQRGPGQPPLLPKRAAVQRRPLREPHEPRLRPCRDRRLGVWRARAPRHRLLPPVVGPSG